MTAEAPAHQRVPGGGILSGCAPDCPACAADQEQVDKRRRVYVRVREIVLGIWLSAIANGERDLERALHEIRAPLLRLPEAERRAVAGEFVLAALEIVPGEGRRLRGKPTEWHKASRQIVDLVADVEDLPKKNVDQFGEDSVFTRVAALWSEWGIPATPREVQDSYYMRG